MMEFLFLKKKQEKENRQYLFVEDYIPLEKKEKEEEKRGVIEFQL